MQEHIPSPTEQVALQQVALLNEVTSRRHTLSDALAKSILEALEVWSVLAQSPGHPAQAAARELLQRWARVLDGIRAVDSGIQVVPGRLTGGNGRT